MKKEIMPGVVLELVSLGEKTMTVRIQLQKGVEVPEHRHPHEQTSAAC